MTSMTEADPPQKRASQRDLGAYKAAVRELLRQISQRNRRLSGLKADLDRLRTQAQELEKTRVDLARSEAVVTALQADKTSLERNLAKTSTELANTRADLAKTSTEKDETIRVLEGDLGSTKLAFSRATTELNTIKESFGYQFMRFYGRRIDALFPDGSRRGELRKIVAASLRIAAREGIRTLLIDAWQKLKRREFRIIEVGASSPFSEALLSTQVELEEWTGQELTFPTATNQPDVSIIIPVYNNEKYTYNCLKSILQNTSASFEVVVVDDGSAAPTKALLRSLRNVHVVTNERNLGFLASCNRGASTARGKDLLFLNNDAIVTENWLTPLLQTISDSTIGAVGSKLVYPDGKLQEAGGIVWKDASGWNYGRYDDPNRPEYNFVRDVDYCSAAALLVRRDVFERIGGFDNRFSPAYYEDTDLCFSTRMLGYRVLYQPKSVVIHFEGQTSGTDTRSGVKMYQQINKQRFYEKWKDVLEREHIAPDAAHLFHARSRLTRKKMLIIDHYVPEFDKDSGSYRMYNIMKILKALGNHITFIGDNLARTEPYTETMQQLGVEVVYVPYFGSVAEYVTRYGEFFDYVILSRAHIAGKHVSEVRKHCVNAAVLFDTVDLQHLREMRRATVEGDSAVFREAMRLKEMEFDLAKMSDLTLVVSPVEKELMLKENPLLKVEVLSNIHEIEPPRRTFLERKDIMFLGGFKHLPNVDAAKYFVQEVFPLIQQRISEVRVYLVGSEPPEAVSQLASDKVMVTGQVRDLLQYFESSRVFVAPLRYGAGLKGKIGESMAHGLPVVTTSIGAEGMNLEHGENALIADDPEEFAKSVAAIYTSEEVWTKISAKSIEYVKKNLSVEAGAERIQQILSLLEPNARRGFSE